MFKKVNSIQKKSFPLAYLSAPFHDSQSTVSEQEVKEEEIITKRPVANPTTLRSIWVDVFCFCRTILRIIY